MSMQAEMLLRSSVITSRKSVQSVAGFNRMTTAGSSFNPSLAAGLPCAGQSTLYTDAASEYSRREYRWIMEWLTSQVLAATNSESKPYERRGAKNSTLS